MSHGESEFERSYIDVWTVEFEGRKRTCGAIRSEKSEVNKPYTVIVTELMCEAGNCTPLLQRRFQIRLGLVIRKQLS